MADLNERLFISYIAATLRLKIPLRDRDVGTWGEERPKNTVSHVAWMLDEVVIHSEDWPIDKLNRWIGYCQGVLACHDVIDIESEINRMRNAKSRMNDE